MLILALILLGLWLIGLISGFVLQGLIHILLVVGLALLIYRLITGRKIV